MTTDLSDPLRDGWTLSMCWNEQQGMYRATVYSGVYGAKSSAPTPQEAIAAAVREVKEASK